MRTTLVPWLAALSLVLACKGGVDTQVTAPDGMAYVPGGSFQMGARPQDPVAMDWEKPAHEVTVRGFHMDRREVTVAAFTEAVEAGVVEVPGCRPRDEWGARVCNWDKADRQGHPVNGVSWIAADAYCRWRDRRLPTEAEFEYAMRRGRKDAVYPWGDGATPPGGWGNYADITAPREHAEGAVLPGYRDGFPLTAPVGSFEPDALGLYDLSGNIWEWCSDWFDPRYYEHGPAQDPGGPGTGERRVLKGGNFYCVVEELRISERHPKRPEDDAVYSGFRCARDAP